MYWFLIIYTLLWGDTPPGCKNYYNANLNQPIYTEVDEEPEFPGGAAAYHRFLNRNVKFPDSANLEDISSTIQFKIIVDTSGQIMQAKMLHADRKDNPLEKEVLRVISQMPKWKPGKCNGKTVAVELTTPMVICFTGS